MRKVHVDEAIGYTLAANVYAPYLMSYQHMAKIANTEENRYTTLIKLLKVGSTIEDKDVKALKKFRVFEVYIDDPRTHDIVCEYILEPQKIAELRQYIMGSVESLQRRQPTVAPGAAQKFKHTVNEVILDIIELMRPNRKRFIQNLFVPWETATEDKMYRIDHSGYCMTKTLLVIYQILEAYKDNNIRAAHLLSKTDKSLLLYIDELQDSSRLELFRGIAFAALLHDVSLLTSNYGFLERNAIHALSDEKWRQLVKHPADSLDIEQKSRVGFCAHNNPKMERLIQHMISYHHINYNGLGRYSTNIEMSKHNIPFLARVLRVVDSFHAMINPRPHKPYKKGMKKYQALKELERLSGVFYDPAIVDFFKMVTAPYDNGDTVRITGDIQATVVQCNPDFSKYEYPMIRILNLAECNKNQQYRDIKFKENRDGSADLNLARTDVRTAGIKILHEVLQTTERNQLHE